MKSQLPAFNGWRRIALVLTVMWMLAACAMAVTSYLRKEDGVFVVVIEKGPIDTSQGASAPDSDSGSQADRALRALEREDARQALKTSEIDPKKMTGLDVLLMSPEALASITARVPIRFPEVQSLRLSLAGFALPIGLWMLAELAVAVALWIGQGFKPSAPTDHNEGS